MKRKGMTLVEVLVATSLFLITFAFICGTYLLTVKGEAKQREYIHFETICLDIDTYSDEYQKNWANKYLEDNSVVSSIDYSTLNEFSFYFDSDYKFTTEDKAKYVINFEYGDFVNESEAYLELKANVVKIENGYYIINDLIYGSRGGRYGK